MKKKKKFSPKCFAELFGTSTKDFLFHQMQATLLRFTKSLKSMYHFNPTSIITEIKPYQKKKKLRIVVLICNKTGLMVGILRNAL